MAKCLRCEIAIFNGTRLVVVRQPVGGKHSPKRCFALRRSLATRAPLRLVQGPYGWGSIALIGTAYAHVSAANAIMQPERVPPGIASG